MKRLLLLFSCSLFITCISHAQTWIPKTNFPGSARFSANAFTTDSNAYLVFGASGSVYYQDLWEYDPLSDQWSLKGQSPALGRRQGVAFAIDSFAYMGLGRRNTLSDLTDFWQYNVNSNSWVQLSAYPGEGTFNAYFGAVRGKGYVAGGCKIVTGITYANELWEFDPSNNNWTQLDSLPFGNRGVGVSVVKDSLLIMGCGHNGSIASKDFWVYNTVDSSWALLPTFPGQARIVPSAFIYQNKMIVGGGQVLGTSTILNDYYEFDFTTNTWSPIFGFAAGTRSRTPSFTLNGIGYLVTGQGTPVNVNNLNDFWMYDNITSIDESSAVIEDKITLFPNPSQGGFNIDPVDQKIERIRIFTLDGKVYEDLLIENQEGNYYHPASLSSGLYFVEISTNKGMQTKKLIVE